MSEEWRAIRGYEESYEISSHGRVRSLPREVVRRGQGSYWTEGKVLSLSPSGVGYIVLSLWRNGKPHSVSAHALVADAFLGPRPAGMDVCHIDGTRTNNRVENLMYASRSDNLKQAVVHGTVWASARKSCPRLHRYSGRNLKWGTPEQKRRECRSCTQERSAASKAKRPFDPVKADAIYYSYGMIKEETNG